MSSIHSNHSNIQISMKFPEMKTEAPDGGLWGWLAVFGCFMGNLIGDGIMYRWARNSLSQCDDLRWTCYKDENVLFFSFGVFLPYFKEHFKAGSGEISTVNSIQMGVTFASGNLEPMMMVMVRIKVDFIFIAKPNFVALEMFDVLLNMVTL